MQYYGLMVTLTGILILLGFLTWHKTRCLAFPLGILFLYYWSLHGAWAIITDKMGGNSGKAYYYLEAKMFLVQLDDNYFWSLLFYGLFAVVVALTVLVRAKAASSEPSVALRQPIVVSHALICLIAVCAGVLSFLIIYPSLEAARAMNVSAYSFKEGRTDLPPLFTLYQVFNRIALVTSAVGLAVVASSRNAKYMRGETRKWTVPAYLLILALMIGQAFMMGDKTQLVFAGLSAVLFYLGNAARPRYTILAALGVMGFLGLAAVDMVRGIPLPLLVHVVTTTSPSEWGDMAQSFSNSNEAFGAHFSMYGALNFHLTPTYGSSVASLVASAVPKGLWENRPDDIYTYYADGVGAKPGQGYTIHHATAWYLNFGVAGLFAGAIVMGLVWTGCYNAYRRVSRPSTAWVRIFALLTPWTFTGFLPTLLRAGPEAYKGVVFEAFLLPTLMFWLASRDWRSLIQSYLQLDAFGQELTNHNRVLSGEHKL